MESRQSQERESGGNRTSKDPVAATIYQHGSFREACGQLALSQLSGREGVFLLLGQRRVGKSTLINHFIRNGRSFGKAVVMTCEPQMSGAELLKALSDKAGIYRPAQSQLDDLSGEVGLTAHEWVSLESSLAEAGRITIVLDSAELSPASVLGIAHKLSMARKDRDRRVSLILVGRPELAGGLNSPALHDLKSDITFRAVLEPVPEREVAAFVTCWLETEYPHHAPLFSDDALARIARESRGVPETIVRICRASIDIASTVPSRKINLVIANQAIAGLEPEPTPARPAGTIVFESPRGLVARQSSPAVGFAEGSARSDFEDFDATDPERDEDWPALPDFELEDYEIEASDPEPRSVPLAADLPGAGARAPLGEPDTRRTTFRGFAIGLALGLAVMFGAAFGVWLTVGSDRLQELLADAGPPAAGESKAEDEAEPAGLSDQDERPAEAVAQVAKVSGTAGAADVTDVSDALVMLPAMVEAPARATATKPESEDLGTEDSLKKTAGSAQTGDTSGSSASVDPGLRSRADQIGPSGPEPAGQSESEALVVLGPAPSELPAGNESQQASIRPAPDDGNTPVLDAAEAGPRSPDPTPGVQAQAALRQSLKRKADGIGQSEPGLSDSGPIATSEPEASTATLGEISDGPDVPPVVSEADHENRSEFAIRNEFERSLSAIKRRNIQQALDLLKLNPGPLDGVIGNQTREAVRTFQASLGLPATGNLEPKLVSLLYGRVEAAKAMSAAISRTRQASPDQTRALPGQARSRTAAGVAKASETPAGLRYPDEGEMEWLKRLATDGDRIAQTNLAQRYYHGIGVRRDHAAAAKWYLLAAERGDATAQTNLGRLYFNGEGVPIDKKKAADWSRVAALQGNPTAQFNLGLMYKHGSGVAKDFKKASHWLRKASESGEPGARSELDQVIAAQKNPPL